MMKRVYSVLFVEEANDCAWYGRDRDGNRADYRRTNVMPHHTSSSTIHDRPYMSLLPTEHVQRT